MLKRPTVNDTEDDILKQQQEFLKSKGNGEKKDEEIISNENIEVNRSEQFSIIGDVVEKADRGLVQKPGLKTVSDGFPSVFRVDPSSKVKNNNKKKKSLFAMKLEGKQALSEELDNVAVVEMPSIDKKIHEENLTKIQNMTKEEIVEEKKSLEQQLSPELLQFLRIRGASKQKQENKPEKSPPLPNPPIDYSQIKENLQMTVDKEFLEMDTIEPEKLQWIGDIPNATSLEPGETYSARFDFAGDLQPFKTEIDVRKSLHHHGEEPDRPGYTIQELYQLSRSTVLQQRILALSTLANIVRKTKMGYYDSCFDGMLLKKLVDSDLFFLLRFSMDDKTTTAAAVHCLHELFVCRSDEICLDRLLNFSLDYHEPVLYVPIETDKDTKEDELKDEQIIAQDLVRGVLRTDLLVRFCYILEVFEPDPITISKIFDIAIRVCRHSQETCRLVFESNIVKHVVANVNSSSACHQAVKLLRVMGSYSQKILNEMSAKIDFGFLLRIIDKDEPLFKLKLECLALWSLFLRNNLLTDLFQSFTPCLCRLLTFYVAQVDIVHGRFDFELFAGIVSVVNAVLLAKNFIDSSYDTVIEACFQKWMTQLASSRQMNYSVAKALGTALNFFILKYNHNVSRNDVNFLTKLLPILMSLSELFFQRACENLIAYSHFACYKNVARDPDNLPSLCSVYHNGENYLKTVHDDSLWPFIEPFAQYLMKIHGISRDFVKPLINVRKCLETFADRFFTFSENNSWFGRYELSVLITTLKMKKFYLEEDSLRFGFKMIPYFRTDDSRVLSVLDISHPCVSSAFQTHLSKTLSNIHYHSCENFPRHWMYEPISVATHETLQCLTTILQNYPELVSNVCPTMRFCHICLVLLNGENIFVPEIHNNLEVCFQDIVANLNQLDLTNVSISEKTFYELYRDLVIEYASCSYGDELFAKIVTLPLCQRFDISYRKLMWSELMHALRAITLPVNLKNFIGVDEFTTPPETDESLLVLYLNAVSNNVLTEKRNGFLYAVAVENIRKFLKLSEKDENLAMFLTKKIEKMQNADLKNTLLV